MAGDFHTAGSSCALRAGVVASAIALCAAAAGLLAAGAAPAQDAGARGGGGRPNFVVIVTDDQTAASFKHRYMPRTHRLLARPGTSFRNFVATTPTCCPSRASMLTGTYAHNHGALSNEIGYPGLRRPRSVLPMWLRRAGYRTGHVGKFLNGYQGSVSEDTTPAPGWDDWHTLLSYRYFDYSWSRNGERVHYGREPRDYVTRTINNTSVRLIHRYAKGSQPFYLQVDQFAPHQGKDPPRSCPRAPHPDPQDEGLFAHEPLPRGPAFNEEDVTDKRTYLRDQTEVSHAGAELIRSRYRCRLASLQAVDRGTQMIWQALQKSREAEDTIVIFTSDNGFFAGQHRIRGGKILPYREASGVPFVVRAPRRLTGGSRVRRVQDLAANIDVAPTVLAYARATPCTRRGCRIMDGRSLVPLLKGRHWGTGREVVIEYGSGKSEESRYGTCEYAGVRRSDAIYVRYNESGRCGPADERELYDLDADPFELDNRAGDPAYEAERAELHARLAVLRDCAGIQGRDPATPGSSGFCD